MRVNWKNSLHHIALCSPLLLCDISHVCAYTPTQQFNFIKYKNTFHETFLNNVRYFNSSENITAFHKVFSYRCFNMQQAFGI